MRDVHLFIAHRRKQGVANATVNRELDVFRHLFEFAVEEGSLTVSRVVRIKRLKEFRGERPRVPETVYRKILRALSECFPVDQIVTFIWETGCRPSEALALGWDQVDLENQTAVLNLRKAGDNALIGLTSRAVEAIRSVPQCPGCPYVFWNPKTRDRYQRINETFRRASKRAGHPTIQLKDFRREAGIVIAESGQPLHVAQTQLGHSSVKTTEKYYAHFSPEFAIGRAREVLEHRGQHPDPHGRQDGRQTGGSHQGESTTRKIASNGASNVVDFQGFRKAVGGGERIRTAE